MNFWILFYVFGRSHQSDRSSLLDFLWQMVRATCKNEITTLQMTVYILRVSPCLGCPLGEPPVGHGGLQGGEVPGPPRP